VFWASIWPDRGGLVDRSIKYLRSCWPHARDGFLADFRDLGAVFRTRFGTCRFGLIDSKIKHLFFFGRKPLYFERHNAEDFDIDI
jgi:hypothetical protein